MAEINGNYEEINDVNLLDYLIKNKYRADRVVGVFYWGVG